jgi:hypothetical protein
MPVMAIDVILMMRIRTGNKRRKKKEFYEWLRLWHARHTCRVCGAQRTDEEVINRVATCYDCHSDQFAGAVQ